TGTTMIRRVLVRNGSADALTLAGLQSSDPRFGLRAGFSDLPPGGSGEIEIRFLPDLSDELHARLDLTFDGPPGQTATVLLVGSGDPDADGDGVADRLDDCPETANPDQAD